MQPYVYEEEDLLPISALQHLIFCERQWALIHLEQIWEENRLTSEGKQLHERVDSHKTETRGNVKISRSLRLRSLKCGLIGVADVVEFHRTEGCEIWRPFPIEYKRGKPKHDLSDTIQLCAQALCLEEMLQVSVPRGALYYGATTRRIDIEFDESLRQESTRLILKLHEAVNTKKTPFATYEKKCLSCSLIHWCLPTCTNGTKQVESYVSEIYKSIADE